MKPMRHALFWISLWLPFSLFADSFHATLHYIGPTSGSAWQGVQQGLKEANQQGAFLGLTFDLVEADESVLADPSQVTVLILATSDAQMLALAEDPQFRDVALLNILSEQDAIRDACAANLLSILPSAQMKQDAVAQWLAQHPDGDVRAQAWHEDFTKFAASQLNRRYVRSFDQVMDDPAWAGWAAVKMVTDSLARTKDSNSADLLEYLKNDIAFDGQKGDGATFRENGQLRQILLLVNAENEIVAEAPLRGIPGGLDSLGSMNCQ